MKRSRKTIRRTKPLSKSRKRRSKSRSYGRRCRSKPNVCKIFDSQQRKVFLPTTGHTDVSTISLVDVADNGSKLYLSGIEGARAAIDSGEIDVVISLCCEEDKEDYRGKVVEHLFINIEDSTDADINRWFDKTYRFITKYRAQGKNILVHCIAGISRSATVIIAYLLRTSYEMGCPLTLKKIISMLKKRRNIIRPNTGFMKRLREYEATL